MRVCFYHSIFNYRIIYHFPNKIQVTFQSEVQGNSNALVTQLKTVLCVRAGDAVSQFLVLLHIEMKMK